MESEKIRIYKLVDVADILKNEQLIKRVFYDVLKVPKNANGHEFSISPISGWINYANNNELFSTTRKKTLLPNESADAEKKVKQFIAKVNKEFSSNQFYKKTGLPLPFNNSIYFIESTLVFEKNNYPNIDHWLVKFGVKVSNGFDSSDVFGASLEVRIGNNANKDFSQIIGFSLKWTPCKNGY